MSESQKMSRTGNQYSKRGSNPRSSVDYAQNDSGQKTERFPSEGMIMLTLSDKGASNLVAWREILRARACDAFGDNGRLFTTGEYYEPEKPNLPDVSQMRGLEKTATESAYTKSVEKHELRRMELISDRTRMYGYLMSNVSDESMAALRADSGFSDCEEKKDVKKLYEIILKTHTLVVGGTGEETQDQANHKYATMIQRYGESTLDYERRFQGTLDGMVAVGLTRPSDPAVAVRFLKSLDRTRYGKLQHKLREEVALTGKGYPNTLAAAVQMAADWWRLIGRSDYDRANKHSDSTNQNSKRLGDQKSSETAFVSVKEKAKDSQKKSVKDGNGKANDGQKKRDRSDVQCFHCKKYGHFKSDCPERRNGDGTARRTETVGCHLEDKCIESDEVILMGVSSFDTDPSDFFDDTSLEDCKQAMTTTMAPGIGEWDVLLDNCASCNLFSNAKMMKNIRDADQPVRINGAGGSLEVELVGDIPCFGLGYFNSNAIANVLSYAIVRRKYSVRFVEPMNGAPYYEVYIPPPIDTTLKFIETRNIYTCNMKEFFTLTLRDQYYFSQVLTVEENEKRFTKRQIKDAKRAQEFAYNLGLPSVRDLLVMLRNGYILNCPVTYDDVKRALVIYGPSLGHLKGATRAPKAPVIDVEDIERPINRSVVLHVDFMFVESISFLISVGRPLDMTMVTHLGNDRERDQKTVAVALQKHVHAYTSQGFSVTTALCDGETSLLTSFERLSHPGLVVNPTGPNQHVPVVEAKIKLIKTKVRGIAASLPYQLSTLLWVYLVMFAVSRINILPTSVHEGTVSPREMFCGRKLDYKRDLRIGFGVYVQAYNPHVRKNSMEERTDGCISLLPTGNLAGSVKFLRLRSNALVVRDKWQILPIPSEVITHLNSIARKDKRPVSRDPTYLRGNIEIDDAGDDDAVGLPTDDTNWFVPPIFDDARDDIEPDTHDVETSSETSSLDDTEFDFAPPAETLPVQLPEVQSELIEPELVTEPAISEPTEDMNQNTSGAEGVEQTRTENTVDKPELYAEEDPPRNSARRSVRLQHGMRNPWTRGPARFREDQYGFHISLSRALELYGDAGRKATRAELEQMITKRVWSGVPSHVTDSVKVIPSQVFIKEKRDSAGNYIKHKARLVAGGHRQDRSLYEDVSSPTVSTSSVMTVLAIAVKEHRYAMTVDIAGAYLNAAIPAGTDIFMRLDKTVSEILCDIDSQHRSFLRTDGTIVVRLEKALYGCVESAKLWYNHLCDVLIKNGFTPNNYDPCVFNRMFDSDQMTVCFHVDDLLITCKSPDALSQFSRTLLTEFKEVTINRELILSYLGMTVDLSNPKVLNIRMDGYIADMLRIYDVEGVATTPATSGLFNVDDSSPELDTERRQQFHSRVAKILYLGKRVRPDLLPTVAFLSTRVQRSTEQDWTKLMRLLQYINGSRQLGLLFEADNDLSLSAYIDAAYGVHADGKSHTGGVTKLGQATIHVKSSKQKLVTKSSTEGELVAVSDYYPDVAQHRKFLEAQGYQLGEVVIYQDNQSTISLMKKGHGASNRSRHINIRYFFMKEREASGEVRIVYKPTGGMLADILTKPLQGELFRKFRRELLGFSRVLL